MRKSKNRENLARGKKMRLPDVPGLENFLRAALLFGSNCVMAPAMNDLTVRVLPTMYDGRTKFARKTLGEIRELFKDMCFDTVIRLNVKLREAAGRGLPIPSYAPSANGAVRTSAVDLRQRQRELSLEVQVTAGVARAY